MDLYGWDVIPNKAWSAVVDATRTRTVYHPVRMVNASNFSCKSDCQHEIYINTTGYL